MDTKQRILNAAFELFFRYGIKSVTMDDIAKHLSISKKTIYQFFRDKDEIVHTLMHDKLEEDKREFAEITRSSANVVEEVFNLMKHMSTILGRINPNIFYDLQKYHPKSWELFDSFRKDFSMKQVEDALNKGIKDGLIRSDINVPALACLRTEEIEMGFNPKIYPPDKFKLLEVQLALTEHFLYGVCTLKGHKLINKYKQVVEEE